MQKLIAQRRTKQRCRISRNLSRVDELAKAGAMMEEGFLAEARAETVQQER